MKRRAPVLDREALAAEIVSLSELGIDELRERWKAMYGKPLSQEIGRSFLIRAIAYRLQEKAFGGLKPSTRRLLARAAEESATGYSSSRSARTDSGPRAVGRNPAATAKPRGRACAASKEIGRESAYG
jgi:hypothetical protein